MILKSILLFLSLIIIPDLYIGIRYLRHTKWWVQLLWYIQGTALLFATIKLAREPDFVPDDMTKLNIYLFVFGLIAVPKAVFSLCSLCGKKGWKVGLALVPILWIILVWGSFVGNNKLEVKHVEIAFSDLPSSFDGYRIVHFSDLHLGSIKESLLKEVVDSINAQKADMIAFTGDIQNKNPSEIEPFMPLLSTLKATDGVFSVMGNHDYALYQKLDPYLAARNEETTISHQMDMKWQMLNNTHRIVRRDSDLVVIAGMENDGEGRFPQKGNINYALWGIDRQQFVIILEHDPSSWRRKILPHSHTQLTLSGHTHGMQFEIFGWAPIAFVTKEYDGLYHIGPRQLYVSKGVGGVVPFRVGASPEIVVITLRKK